MGEIKTMTAGEVAADKQLCQDIEDGRVEAIDRYGHLIGRIRGEYAWSAPDWDEAYARLTSGELITITRLGPDDYPFGSVAHIDRLKVRIAEFERMGAQILRLEWRIDDLEERLRESEAKNG